MQLSEKLKGTFCRVFFDNFFTSPVLMRKLQEHDLDGVGVVRAGRKLLPEIEVPKKKKEKNNEAAKKKRKKDIPLVSGKKFKDDKSFQRGESDFLVSKDGVIILL